MPISAISILAYEDREYDGVVYHFPILDYAGTSYCIKCGSCCRDWKAEVAGEANPERCEYLRKDNQCQLQVSGKPVREGCVRPCQPYMSVDLPDTCGYIKKFKELGYPCPKDPKVK